jgi:hypothetical protein
MIDYKKIAVMLVRMTALSFLLSGILDLAMVSCSILLISLNVIPQDAIAHEAWFIQSTFFIIGGMILYGRSNSVATSIVSGLVESEQTESD